MYNLIIPESGAFIWECFLLGIGKYTFSAAGAALWLLGAKDFMPLNVLRRLVFLELMKLFGQVSSDLNI